mgnify:CR=1 FL=1
MYKFTLKTFKRKVVSEGTLLINHNYYGLDSTTDSSTDQPSYVPQIQTDSSDSSSSTFHQDEVVKRLDSRTNNSKDVP